jgi:TldD protein
MQDRRIGRRSRRITAKPAQDVNVSSAQSGLPRRQFLELSAAAVASAAVGVSLTACATGGARSARTIPAPNSDPLAAFDVSETQVRQVLARALQSGGDFCDLFFQRGQVNKLELEDGAVNLAQSKNLLGLGVRVVRGVETGYAYSESLDLRSMLDAAAVAASVASAGQRPAPQALRVGRSTAHYPVTHPWDEIGTEKKVELLNRVQRLILAEDSRLRKINLNYRDEDFQVVVVDSDGRVRHDRQPMAVLNASCVAEQKGRRESNYSAIAGRGGFEYFNDQRLGRLVKEAVQRTVLLFDAVPGPVGELPVVLGPGSSGILLHEAIGHGMEADFARKKMTIYSDRVGKRIASPLVTIVDDGTNPGFRGSINVDDEGNAGARTVLVEQGILRTFLHDRISAKHFNVAPTGSGRRQSFRHMPLPRMRNTYMLAGPHGREELIRSIKRGIYAEHFTNGQVQIGPGDFTFYIKSGMLIEDGKLTRPIKDVNIIGNGPEVLRRVSMVGNDFALDEGGWTCGKRGQMVPVGLGMPSVKVDAITVGGTAQGKKRGAGRHG